MKKYAFFILSFFLLLSCQRNRERYETYTNLQPLRLGIIPTVDCLPFLVAQEQGYYDSLGLDLSIIKYTSAAERNTAFLSERIDGAIADYTEAIQLSANGTPLGIVMENNSILYLISGRSSHIHSPQELKGKNIAISRNTAAEYTLDQILAKAHIRPEEVNKPEFSRLPLQVGMLQSGQIDAAILPDPFATTAMRNGHNSLTTTKETGISVTGTLFSQKALSEKRREVEVLLKGYNLGVTYMKEHSRNDWKRVLTEEIGMPEALTGHVQLPKYKDAKLPARKDIEATLGWLKHKKLIPQSYNGESLTDTIKGVRLK